MNSKLTTRDISHIGLLTQHFQKINHGELASTANIHILLRRINFRKPPQSHGSHEVRRQIYTRWFKYDRDYLCVNKSQFVPVIFEPPCIRVCESERWKACCQEIDDFKEIKY
jgi:hypothetical protein